MKIIISFAFYFSTMYLVSQNYIPFPNINDSISWYHAESYWDAGQEGYTNRYFLHFSDTVTLNGKVYKVLLRTNEAFAENGSVEAYIREDSQKVYTIYPPIGTTEYLLYDFNLNIGDTFVVKNFKSLSPINSFQHILTNIDTLMLNDSILRRKFIFDNLNYSFVEGLGNVDASNSGLFETWGGTYLDYASWVNCITTPNKIIYSVPFNDLDCYTLPPVSVKNINSNASFHIYPNPNKSDLLFLDNSYNISRAIITSLSGKIILEKKLEKQNQINISILSKGIYFILLETDNGIFAEKIVKL